MPRSVSLPRVARPIRRWMDLSINAKGLVVIAVPMFMLLAATCSYAITRAENQRAEKAVDHTLAVRTTIDQVLRRTFLISAGVRGYLLTAEPGLLRAPDREQAALPQDIDDLRSLVRDNPAQTGRVNALDTRVSELVTTLDQLRRAGPAAVGTPRERQLLARAQATLDDVVATATEMLDTEAGLLATRRADAARWRRLTTWSVICSAVLGTLGGLLVSLMFTLGIGRRLNRAAQNAERLAAGQPLVLPPYPGDDEIGRLDLATAHAAGLLTERTTALEQAVRDVESFSYSVAHDLRTPLRAIGGFSERLLRRHGDRLDEQGRHYAERIHSAAGTMGALIDDLLRFSSATRTALNPRPTDASAMVGQIAAELSADQPERRVAVEIQDGVTINADPTLLRVALGNLVGNAWKFSTARPVAHIDFGTEPAAPGEVGCFVRDDGAGFDPAYAGKLFQPFHRLHDTTEFPGTGIGLALVRTIVERHGGRVWAEGRPDRGATIHFTFAGQER